MGIIIIIIIIIIVAVLMGGICSRGMRGGLYTLAQKTARTIQARNDISTINQPTKETQNTQKKKKEKNE